MSRRIVTSQPALRPISGDLSPQAAGAVAVAVSAPSASTTSDDYLGRLLKYIPAELVGLYLAARGIVPRETPDLNSTLWIIAAVTWVLVPIYLHLSTRRGGQKPLVWQIVLGTIAFPVWVFAIGGSPVLSIPWYSDHQFVGSLVLMFVTVLFGLKQP